jgi:hypothetical protein
MQLLSVALVAVYKHRLEVVLLGCGGSGQLGYFSAQLRLRRCLRLIGPSWAFIRDLSMKLGVCPRTIAFSGEEAHARDNEAEARHYYFEQLH